MEFTRIGEIPRDPWSVLIYGLPKVGKTIFSCGAPDPLLCAVDMDGEISLRNHPELSHVLVEKTRTFDSLVKLLKLIRKEKPTEFKTIIIDTVTALQEQQRLDLVDENTILSTNKTAMDQNLYSINNLKVQTLVRVLMELKSKYNIILNCHLKEETVGPPGAARIVSRPALSGALMQAVNATVNGVYVLEGASDKRRLTVKGNAMLLAAGRYKIDKPYLPDPTFDHLRKYLER